MLESGTQGTQQHFQHCFLSHTEERCFWALREVGDSLFELMGTHRVFETPGHHISNQGMLMAMGSVSHYMTYVAYRLDTAIERSRDRSISDAIEQLAH